MHHRTHALLPGLVLCLIAFVTSASSEERLYLVKPALDSAALGFTLNREEIAEHYTNLVAGCANAFRLPVTMVPVSQVPALKAQKAEILVFDIEHFHFLWDDAEHMACMKAALYRFSSVNNYDAPVFAGRPPRRVGEEYYGDNNPVEDAIERFFRALPSASPKKGAAPQPIPRISVDEAASPHPLSFASSKVYVQVCALNDSTIGYVPADYEMWHLPRLIAHYIGDLVSREYCMLEETFRDSLKTVKTQVAVVNLEMKEDGSQWLTLRLYTSLDMVNPTYSVRVQGPPKKDWTKDQDFQDSMEKMFGTIGENFAARGK